MTCEGLTSVTIPWEVISIGEYAFFQCAGLTSITNLAREPQEIGQFTFYNVDRSCILEVPNVNRYREATIWREFLGIIPTAAVDEGTCGAAEDGSNVKWTLFESDVFNFCYSLVISGTGAMKDYNYDASYKANKSRILKVTIEEGVTTVGTDAFEDFKSVMMVTLPSSVTNIKLGAFSNCRSLSTIDIPNRVDSLGTYCFDLTALRTVVIPNSVKFIASKAFWDCKRLETVTIGSGVKSIGSSAFRDCEHLTTVINLSPVPQSFDRVFEYVDLGAVTLLVPAAAVGAYKRAEGWKEFGEIEKIQ
jgi:hypothetical protein